MESKRELKVIEFPKNKNTEYQQRQEFKEYCKSVIDKLEGDFSLVFSGSEDIFTEKINTDTIIITTNEEKYHQSKSSFKTRRIMVEGE